MKHRNSMNRIRVLNGTCKGAFMLTSDASRQDRGNEELPEAVQLGREHLLIICIISGG